jgi:hypothetical protein
MRAVLLTIAVFLLALPGLAQQNYNTDLIPKELLSYASAVVRNSNEGIEVKDLDNATYHIKQAITVLNKNGDNQADMVLYYNKSNTIKYIKGSIYNATGKLTAKFTERDFEDEAVDDGFSLFIDYRVKHYQPAVMDYPYTVEYEYEIRSKQTLLFEDWQPNGDTGVAVEKSIFTFTCKPDFGIRYKELNTPQKVTISNTDKGLKVYQWQINNLKVVRYEPFSPDADHYLTRVKITPEKFSYEGINGAFNNWQDLGKWIYDKLLLGRDVLPPETIATVKELTAGTTDPKLKAKKLYEYMQHKTRYVSIQVGIGGYQPFLASDVDKVSYGDCKALVNYTHALLKTAGIDSWYCVVKSGSRKKSFMSDFASMDQGDHVILCLPFKNDTTWLECTSQKIPFGYLGDFTDDRTVLACTPEGGKLLHTPAYEATNLVKRKASFVIDDKGNLSGSMNTTFTGVNFEDREKLINEPYTEQLKGIKNIYPINNFEVEKLEYAQNKTPDPVTTETIKFNSREFASINADKLYFKVDMANRVIHAPDEVRNRKTDVYINRGYADDDELTFQLPAGYRPDKVLLNKKIDKPFGKFTVSMVLNGRELTYKRYFRINKGSYDKETYQDLVDFYEAVADADSYTLALIKNN